MECIEMRFGNVRGASVSDVQYLNEKQLFDDGRHKQ